MKRSSGRGASRDTQHDAFWGDSRGWLFHTHTNPDRNQGLTVRRNWISSSASPPSAMMSSVSPQQPWDAPHTATLARAPSVWVWVRARARASSWTALGFHLWRHSWRILILIHRWIDVQYSWCFMRVYLNKCFGFNTVLSFYLCA